MCYQQRVESVLFEFNSKTTQAASIIHERSVARSSCQLPVTSCQFATPFSYRNRQLGAGNCLSKTEPPDSRQVLRGHRRLWTGLNGVGGPMVERCVEG